MPNKFDVFMNKLMKVQSNFPYKVGDIVQSKRFDGFFFITDLGPLNLDHRDGIERLTQISLRSLEYGWVEDFACEKELYRDKSYEREVKKYLQKFPKRSQ